MRALLLILFAFFAAAPVMSQTPFRSDRILVETRGRGPDVVLIPGLASTAAVWRRTADRLDDRYRVHLVTVKGFGPTDPGANAEGAVSAPVANEIRRYIAAQRMQRPALIGHSLGGQIALRIAAADGRRIGRVMVVDAAPFFPSLISDAARSQDVEPIARIAWSALMLLGDDALTGQGRSLGARWAGRAAIAGCWRRDCMR